MRILMADDDSDDRQLFEKALSETAYDISFQGFESGQELLDYLFAVKDDELPNILFLDLNMPGIRGLDILQEIRKERRFVNVGIAIYSTSKREKDMISSLAYGANCYIVKPIDFSHLRRILMHVLSINLQFQESGLDMETFVISVE